jgi:hypothetical protein
MKQKRDDADTELERPFGFSKARPIPYVGWSRRAKGQPREVPRDPGVGKEVPVSPSAGAVRPAREKKPR